MKGEQSSRYSVFQRLRNSFDCRIDPVRSYLAGGESHVHLESTLCRLPRYLESPCQKTHLVVDDDEQALRLSRYDRRAWDRIFALIEYTLPPIAAHGIATEREVLR